jgi:ketosteroid isomerase-like protein
VVVFAAWRGRGKASGVPTEWRFGSVLTLREGRVINIESYREPAEALEAAGLSE